MADVLLRQQHLCDLDPVCRAGLLVVPHERGLADGGRRLLLRDGPRPPAEPQARGAGGDRSRGYEGDLDTARHHRGDLGRERLDAGTIGSGYRVGDEPATNLHDHPTEPAARHGWAPAPRSAGSVVKASPMAARSSASPWPGRAASAITGSLRRRAMATTRFSRGAAPSRSILFAATSWGRAASSGE